MVIWTVENVHNELMGIAKEISRKNVGGAFQLPMMMLERCEMS